MTRRKSSYRRAEDVSTQTLRRERGSVDIFRCGVCFAPASMIPNALTPTSRMLFWKSLISERKGGSRYVLFKKFNESRLIARRREECCGKQSHQNDSLSDGIMICFRAPALDTDETNVFVCAT